MRWFLRPAPAPVEARPVPPMRRREQLHGIGMGTATDPGNTQLVLVPRGPLVDSVHDAVADALREEPNGIFTLPRAWLHLTLDYRWDPDGGRGWRTPAGGVRPIHVTGGRIEATEWSLRLIPDNQAAIADAARAWGVVPPEGAVFAITLAYATTGVPAPAVRRLLGRVGRRLGSRGLEGRVRGPLVLDRVERRHVAPDQPLCWQLEGRWQLGRDGRVLAVGAPAEASGHALAL